MTAAELANLIQRMRAAQRDYFRGRSRDALERSKRLEREVDAAVAAILSPAPTLFPDPQPHGENPDV